MYSLIRHHTMIPSRDRVARRFQTFAFSNEVLVAYTYRNPGENGLLVAMCILFTNSCRARISGSDYCTTCRKDVKSKLEEYNNVLSNIPVRLLLLH
jgi:hypothetical protein